MAEQYEDDEWLSDRGHIYRVVGSKGRHYRMAYIKPDGTWRWSSTRTASREKALSKLRYVLEVIEKAQS